MPSARTSNKHLAQTPGDPVRVVSGPFKWIEGLFDRSLSASGRVRILLSQVHGCVAVQLGATELELAANRFS
jgi:transcription antitermination factor NusG